MIQPLLKLEVLKKSFDQRPILDITQLELFSGKSYVLTGGNGAGKSTLLRVLAGLEPAEMSNLIFEGKRIEHEKYPLWLRQQIIYVHQQPYLFHTSIEDNIGYGLKIRGIEKKQRLFLIEEAMQWAGVSYLKGIDPHKLSGGEKQRVALARAKVLNPKLFLLDEPTANLDEVARKQVIDLITSLCEKQSAVVIACHDKELIQLPHILRLHLKNTHIGESSSNSKIEAVN